MLPTGFKRARGCGLSLMEGGAVHKSHGGTGIEYTK